HPYATRVNSTLVVSNLANGGVPSSIGASSSAASNLVLSGGTLKYVGGATSSDRLFSIDAPGATLDASGTGPLNLTNTGPVAVLDVGPISAATISTGGNARLINGVADISRLTPGMTVVAATAAGATFLPAGAKIQGIAPNFGFTGGSPFILTNQIVVDLGATAAATNATLTFGNQNRNLTLTGSNTGPNTLAALLTDSAAGKLGIVKNGSGSWVLTNNNTFTGGVTVNQGQLTVNYVRNNQTTITGGTLKIADGPVGSPANTSVFVEGAYNQTGGRFDLNKSGAVFDYDVPTLLGSPLATIAGLIDSAYATGDWSGNGITSSAAAANPNTHAVGYAEASDIGFPPTFLGQAIDSTAVLVRYTRQGDANLDASTDLSDFALLASNFNQSGSSWSRGDFNYDGTTDLSDFALLAGNFNQFATGALPRAAAVPEPSAAGLLAAAALLGLRRRRA
ncbi:MAG: autotransporter-associated beta strand repeat-containing protein, partial [Phycisphaerae bacterium]|nr:autotransporter-associated beta strand repeat-containing protein [Phycisphaerae bacterium]